MKKDESSYEATATHPEMGGRVVAGRIVFTHFQFRFESETVTFEIPYRDLTFHLEEPGAESLVFFEPPGKGWLVHYPDLSILEHRAFSGNNGLRRQKEAILGKKVSSKALKATVAFFAIALAIGVSVSWVLDRIVRFSVNRIPASAEQKLGDSEYEEVKHVMKLSQDPVLIAKLEALMARMRPGLPDTNMTVQFHIMETEIPNAGSIPGHVFVTRGLFDLLATPEEMAGVLGHELGHINEKHVFRLIISAQGPAYVLSTAFRSSGGTMTTIARSSQFMIGRSFSRKFEREADDAGWNYLVRANIDPRGLRDALQKLRDIEYKYAGGRGEAMFATHPPTEARIDRLEAHWKKLKTKTGFIDLEQAVNWRN